MSREIKFRAWDKTEKRMCPVIALIYWDPKPGDPYELGSCEIDNGKGAVRRRYIEDIELMQYTGIKDRTGDEIYEGDIVRHATFKRLGTVAWVDNGPGFTILRPDKAGNYVLHDEWEVIGNVYEHRHMLPEEIRHEHNPKTS